MQTVRYCTREKGANSKSQRSDSDPTPAQHDLTQTWKVKRAQSKGVLDVELWTRNQRLGAVPTSRRVRDVPPIALAFEAGNGRGPCRCRSHRHRGPARKAWLACTATTLACCCRSGRMTGRAGQPGRCSGLQKHRRESADRARTHQREHTDTMKPDGNPRTKLITWSWKGFV